MLSGGFSVITEYKNPLKQRIVIIEVSPEIYNIIVNSGYKIYIGYQCCKMYDVINLSLCFKCGRLNHSSKNCKNEIKCLKCLGNHSTTSCESNTLKCLNCDFYNLKFGQSKCTNHYPNDTNKCEYLNYRLNKLLNVTDYPTLPIVPNHLGKIAVLKSISATDVT